MSPDQIFEQGTTDRLAAAGQALYEERLKPLLEPKFNGQVVAVHLGSGEFAVARNSPDALRALYEKRPDDGMTLTRVVGPDCEDPTLFRMLASEVASGLRK